MPAHIGKYEILGELGVGGFGRVFLGFDPIVRRKVAIKVLNSDGDSSQLPRFRTEATAAGNLRHKNIVVIHEFADDHGTFFMVMEYLEGRNLAEVIAHEGSYSLLDKLRMMTQAAEGLLCAHQNGIVHRDVKPANIMLLGDGTVKVMDFGIARLTQDSSVRLTQTGFVIGSVFYMSPEQLNGNEADARGDIWAFGAIFYELLCGRHPFDAPDAASGMYRIMHWEPEPIQNLCPECPDALAAVLTRLLTKDRESRYQSFEDVLFDTAPILVDLESRQADQLAAHARSLIQAGRLEEAESAVKRILSVDPSHNEGRAMRQEVQALLKARSQRARALSYVEQAERAASSRDFDAAIQAVESALRLDSQDASLPPRLAELRAAKQRAETAEAMVESARLNLQQDNISTAWRLLNDALNAEPGNLEAQRLLTGVNQQLAKRDEERRFRERLGKVKGLLAFQSFDEAVSELESLAAEAPQSEEVRAALESARRQQAEDQRRRTVQAELDAAKGEIKAARFQAAIERLEPLLAESSSRNDVAGLLAYARTERDAALRLSQIKSAGAEAWSLFKAEQFDQALARVEEALLAFSGDQSLLKLRQAILNGRADHQQRAFLERTLEETAQLERDGMLEQASANLERALRQYPAEASLREASARVQSKLTEQREQAQASARRRDLGEATALIERGQLLEATRLLQQIGQAYPGDTSVVSLLGRVRAEEQRRERLEQLLAQVQAYLDNGLPEQACETAARGRTEFGLDPRLIAAEASAQAARARKQVIEDAQRAMDRRDWPSAASILEAALERDPEHAEAARLREEVRSRESGVQRRARRDAGRREAELLMESARFEDAVRALRALHDEFPDDAVIRDELRAALDAIDQQVRRDAYTQGRQRAGAALRSGQYKSAITTLEDLLQQFPGDPMLQADLKSATEAEGEQVRRERYTSERKRAAGLVQARQFDQAIAVLKGLLTEFPADVALEEDLKSAAGARGLHQQREALELEIAQLEKLYRKGDARAVQQKAAQLPADLEDARVRELMDWADAEISRAAQGPSREPAESLQRRRKRRIAAGLGLTAIVAAAAVLVPLALRKGPPAGSLTAQPRQLNFTFAPGSAASSENLNLDGTAKGTRWSVRSTESWLSVTPGQGVAPATLTVSVDPAKLSPATTYFAQLIFSSPDGAPGLLTDVKVSVTAPPAPSPQPPVKPSPGGAGSNKKKNDTSGVVVQPAPPRPVVVTPPPPPLPKLDDCGSNYTGRTEGKLQWDNPAGGLKPNGELVIGGPNQDLQGGRVRDMFLHCKEVTFKEIAPKDVVIEQSTRPEDNYSSIKLRNTSPAMTVTQITVSWTIR